MEQYFKYDVRKYFEQYTSFENKSVLDFGCNHGNFIRFQPHNNYTGIDIDKNIIDTNQQKMPQYNWQHYDGYNYMYNPTGKETVEIKDNYDVAVCFSVITHMTVEEMENTIGLLKSKCDKVLVSYYSNKDEFAYKNICKYRGIEADEWEDISNSNYFYLKTKLWWTFYNDEWLEDTFNTKSYTTSFGKNDLRGMQRCLVL